MSAEPGSSLGLVHKAAKVPVQKHRHIARHRAPNLHRPNTAPPIIQRHRGTDGRTSRPHVAPRRWQAPERPVIGRYVTS